MAAAFIGAIAFARQAGGGRGNSLPPLLDRRNDAGLLGDAELAKKSHDKLRSPFGVRDSCERESTATLLLSRELALEDIAPIGMAPYNFYKH